jgi:hypothetical protein
VRIRRKIDLRILNRWNSGATRLGFADVLTAVILLAVLLWASWKQFPAYNRDGAPQPGMPPAPVSAPPTRPGDAEGGYRGED